MGKVSETVVEVVVMLVTTEFELALNGLVPAAHSLPLLTPSPSSSAASHTALPACASVTP